MPRSSVQLDQLNQELMVHHRQRSFLNVRSQMSQSPQMHANGQKTTCKVHNILNIEHEENGSTVSAPPEQNDPFYESSTPQSPSSLPLEMSKHELADMVVSVRDLSTSLSNVSMKMKLTNILIVTKIHDTSLIPLTRELALWLLEKKSEGEGMNIFVQDILKNDENFNYKKLLASGNPNISRLKFWTEDVCTRNPNLFDFVITLGGDGTVLYASWLFQHVVPPVLSFGLGSLGFMTESDYSMREEIIKNILETGFYCSLRMRFECTIMRATSTKEKGYDTLMAEVTAAEADGRFQDHIIEETYSILNDVVVDRGPNPTITTTELYGDYRFLTAVEADGVVISTPSGSTAYSLSAGGSLVHPDIPAMLISPICPHTLSFRPLVVPDSLVVRVGVPYDARASAWCSFDGKSRIELRRGDILTVSASRYPFPKVHAGDPNNWFSRLSHTLHWNERSRQKPL